MTGATDMRFRDAGGVWSAWEPYGATKDWTMAGADGLKVVEGEFRNAAQEVLDCPASTLLDTQAPDKPASVSATWVRLSGNSGRVSVSYVLSEAQALTASVVTVAIKTGSGVTKKSATYASDALDNPIAHSVSLTLTKASYRLVVSVADAAGNAAPSSVTALFAVH